jgi:hypothetical protein
MRALLILLPLLAACAVEPDRAAIAKCQGMGNAPGTAEYDTCVREESAARVMEQQRREYDQMKQNEQDWKLRRY